MKRVLKIVKRVLLGFLSLMVLLAILVILFLNFSPQIGGDPSSENIETFKKSGHYHDGEFENLIPTNLDYSFSNMVKILKKFWEGNPKKSPQTPPKVFSLDVNQWKSDTSDKMMWFGHSAILVKIDGKNLLLDPMLGKSPAPHPAIGTKRYYSKLPVEIEDLPSIDIVIISHDHYDHLDYGSILKLKSKTKQFVVPLGVGAHLKKWGVESDRITELNWWEDHKIMDLKLTFLPSRHFSGRGLLNGNSTMWGSWAIEGIQTNLYFSGDGGYGPHFKQIGEELGPFDMAFMECGQYNENWSEIHMMPNETVKAASDVKAKVFMPIHWGAFTLALHDWNEPPIVSKSEAETINQSIIIPQIGQVLPLDTIKYNSNEWWTNP